MTTNHRKANADFYFIIIIHRVSTIIHLAFMKLRTRWACLSGDATGLLPTSVPVDHAVSGQ